MIRLIKLILLLAFAVWIGLTFQGKMIITFLGWRIDLELWMAFLIFGLFAIMGYVFWQLLSSVFAFPAKLKRLINYWITDRKERVLASHSHAVVLWKEKLSINRNNLPAFRKIPRRVRNNPDILSLYAKLLVQCGNPISAERFIRRKLQKHWIDSLVKYYGEINHPQPEKLLIQGEKWLKRHPQSAALFYALGELCEKLSLWGKAQRYLETSITLSPTPEAYAKLGGLLERRAQPLLASENYKKGLILSQEKEGFALDA